MSFWSDLTSGNLNAAGNDLSKTGQGLVNGAVQAVQSVNATIDTTAGQAIQAPGQFLGFVSKNLGGGIQKAGTGVAQGVTSTVAGVGAVAGSAAGAVGAIGAVLSPPAPSPSSPDVTTYVIIGAVVLALGVGVWYVWK